MPGRSDFGILCVGRLYCDLIFTGVPRMPSPGTEVYANGLEMHLGGGAIITAQHLDSIGRKVFFASFLPTPPFRSFVDRA